MIVGPIRERFVRGFAKHESGCWLWVKSLDGHMYGQFAAKGYSFRQAHKWAWTIYRGAVPAGMSVLHTCDVPACVNPNHLFLGSQKDNMRDMYAKGRMAVGGPAPWLEWRRNLMGS